MQLAIAEAPLGNLLGLCQHANSLLIPAFATATPPSYSQVGDVVCVRHERDLFRVMTSLVQSGLTVAEAAVKARSDWNKKHIRTSHPPDMGRRLKEIRDDFQKKSDACVARGGKPFFL